MEPRFKNRKPKNDPEDSFEIPQPEPIYPPRFQVGDYEANQFLNENGYVVFASVATPEEVQTGIDLFWQWAEGLGFGLERNNTATWQNKNWMASGTTGVIFGRSIGQSEFLWHCRSLPPVKEAFTQLWCEENLIVSFDGSGVFRPPDVDPSWSTKGGWYHFDQNGHVKKGRQGLQGILNLLPSEEDDGGLVVVPGSHTHFSEVFTRFPAVCGKGGQDFVLLKPNSPVWGAVLGEWGLRPRKICAAPGDLLIFDSRTIHCNFPAKARGVQPGAVAGEGVLGLRRLVAYICMSPARMVGNETILQKRIEACKKGYTTNHWPHEFHGHLMSATVPGSFKPPQLTPHQKLMVTGGLIPFD